MVIDGKLVRFSSVVQSCKLFFKCGANKLLPLLPKFFSTQDQKDPKISGILCFIAGHCADYWPSSDGYTWYRSPNAHDVLPVEGSSPPLSPSKGSSLKIGDLVYSFNPRHKDGTRLRSTPTADGEDNGVWLPNDTACQVADITPDFIKVQKPDGDCGWTRRKNISLTPPSQRATKQPEKCDSSSHIQDGSHESKRAESRSALLGSGRYVLGEQIGKGAFGVVYLGMDVSTAEHVAVKEMPIEDKNDLTSAAALKAEFDNLVTLRHPNVVGVRGFDLCENKAYLYMEWMPGGSVSGMIAQFKFRLHEGLIRRYTRHVVLGLSYLHHHDVVHRDIKPGNMLVSRDGSVKLSDFGTCTKKLADKTAATMKMVGTPCYMAPEAIRGKVTPASDVWAVGASVVEMASGCPPWSELCLADPISMLFHIGMSGEHPQIPEHLSQEGKHFLARCFCIDPKDRATCEELLEHPFVVADPTTEDNQRGLEGGVPNAVEALDDYLSTRQATCESLLERTHTLTCSSLQRTLEGTEVCLA